MLSTIYIFEMFSRDRTLALNLDLDVDFFSVC